VNRNVVDPSAVLRILVYSLLTTVVTRTLNPQNDAGRVNGAAGPNCHLCPRPARAGEAVTTPPSKHSSAPSATITPSRRLITIPSKSCPDRISVAAQSPLHRTPYVRAVPASWDRKEMSSAGLGSRLALRSRAADAFTMNNRLQDRRHNSWQDSARPAFREG
jgi:hypothetical protein